MANFGTRQISFDCSKCGTEVTEEEFELPGYDYSSDSHADGIGTEDITIYCHGCERQYRVEVANMFDQFSAEIHSHPKIKVKIFVEQLPDWDDEYDYQQYLKTYVPTEPYERFTHSLELIDSMLASAKAVTDYPVFQRMLFLQYIAMMEAYLCDRLLLLTAGIDSVRIKLIQNYPGLQNQKYPLTAFVSEPEFITKKTTTFLKAQLYHELDAVEAMYKAALDASPFPDEQNKLFLKAATINRHHCVHREGKDNDGAVLEEVNEAYVQEVRQKITALASHMEATYAVEIEKIQPLMQF
ncbi:hypothetical protein [Agrobacterium fabrum]|uniref:hypothetical protein n=1 Tax=Agrobacterium fabrum TaxID=1176649 RepID=UPI00298ED551|nr:hypothetical protein [Agrobacterium fabrum]